MIGLMPFAGVGTPKTWELFYNGTSAILPTGLQTGDIGFLLQAVSFTTPTAPATPTGWTQRVFVEQVRTVQGGGEKNPTYTYFGGASRVSYRTLSSANNSQFTGASGSVRILVFRPKGTSGAATITNVGSDVTSGTYNQNLNLSSYGTPILPTLGAALWGLSGPFLQNVTFAGNAADFITDVALAYDGKIYRAALSWRVSENAADTKNFYGERNAAANGSVGATIGRF